MINYNFGYFIISYGRIYSYNYKSKRLKLIDLKNYYGVEPGGWASCLGRETSQFESEYPEYETLV